MVGGGPAGSRRRRRRAARARPGSRVLILDRSEFPRDKPCGDGIAAGVLDRLAGLGVDPGALTGGRRADPPPGAASPAAAPRSAGSCGVRCSRSRAPCSTTGCSRAVVDARCRRWPGTPCGPSRSAAGTVVLDGAVPRTGGRRRRRRRVGGAAGARRARQSAAGDGRRRPRVRPAGPRPARHTGARPVGAPLARVRLGLPDRRRARESWATGSWSAAGRPAPICCARWPQLLPAAAPDRAHGARPPAARCRRPAPDPVGPRTAGGRRTVPDQPAHRRGDLHRRRVRASWPAAPPCAAPARARATGAGCAGNWARTCGTPPSCARGSAGGRRCSSACCVAERGRTGAVRRPRRVRPARRPD